MKYYIISLALIMLACSAHHHEEPTELPAASAMADTGRGSEFDSEETQIDFTGAYVSAENCRDKIEIFNNNSFYYLEDCNLHGRMNDLTLRRIGRWSHDESSIFFNYEDGGFATATYAPDSLRYFENGIETLFLPSSEVHINVGIDPGFSGNHDKEP